MALCLIALAATELPFQRLPEQDVQRSATSACCTPVNNRSWCGNTRWLALTPCMRPFPCTCRACTLACTPRAGPPTWTWTQPTWLACATARLLTCAASRQAGQPAAGTAGAQPQTRSLQRAAAPARCPQQQDAAALPRARPAASTAPSRT